MDVPSQMLARRNVFNPERISAHERAQDGNVSSTNS